MKSEGKARDFGCIFPPPFANHSYPQSCSCIPLGTLRDWEQGRSEPDQPARASLTVTAGDAEGVRRVLEAKPG